jgi:hypothetical protein
MLKIWETCGFEETCRKLGKHVGLSRFLTMQVSYRVSKTYVSLYAGLGTLLFLRGF